MSTFELIGFRDLPLAACFTWLAVVLILYGVCAWLWARVRRQWVGIPFSGTGHCCFITGAGDGLGQRVALRFAAEYAAHHCSQEEFADRGPDLSPLSQVFCGVLSEEQGRALVGLARQQTGDDCARFLHPVVCDVASDASVEACRKTVEDYCAQHGLALKVVVNNAGVSAFGFAECLPLARFRQNMEVNFFGAVRVSKAFLPILRANKPSRLLNMGSVGALKASGFGSAYLCSKAAMCHLNECLREELQPLGVRVVMLQPGFFASNLLDRASSNGASESDPALSRVYCDYGAMMAETAKNIAIFERLNGGIGGAACIAEAALEAATARFPKSRYLLGIDGYIRATLSPVGPRPDGAGGSTCRDSSWTQPALGRR
ncbi:unnamed protein product [Prorocentrum cordatum]|uniref:Uncharacterized protein n=1 Tax=Prorocentrum cordatum TaxID=2364126 RepID=A0ABN9R0U2_9DINO|nr:unnamed protein product [Polarella glacialis]